MPAYYIGEHLVSDFAGSHEILEGDWKPNRVVVIEFPDIASIKNWYQSPEYQPLIALRQSAATDVMIMLEGLQGRCVGRRLCAELTKWSPACLSWWLTERMFARLVK